MKLFPKTRHCGESLLELVRMLNLNSKLWKSRTLTTKFHLNLNRFWRKLNRNYASWRPCFGLQVIHFVLITGSSTYSLDRRFSLDNSYPFKQIFLVCFFLLHSLSSMVGYFKRSFFVASYWSRSPVTILY